MHGKDIKRTKEDVNQQKTHLWLRGTGLKAETEGLIIAAQDQSLTTRCYQCHMIKDGTNPKCRVCGKYETADHIISGCPELAKNEYTQRHNKVVTVMHWKIFKKHKIETTERWYDYQPDTVTQNNDVIIFNLN